METAGQQMVAKLRLIGPMHHSQLVFGASASMAALPKTPWGLAPPLSTGGIETNFGN